MCGAPDADDLVAGELAINTVDKKLYFEDSSGNIQEIKDSTTLAAEVQADPMFRDKFRDINDMYNILNSAKYSKYEQKDRDKLLNAIYQRHAASMREVQGIEQDLTKQQELEIQSFETATNIEALEAKNFKDLGTKLNESFTDKFE